MFHYFKIVLTVYRKLYKFTKKPLKQVINMPIVGFNFTKITAEKNNAVKGNISINTNVQIKDVKDTKMKMPSKQKTIEVDFHYIAKFDPKLGSMDFEGNMILLEDEKRANELLKYWKKNKKLPDEFVPVVMNTALNRCSIEAVILSKDINLPAPVQMPKIGPSKKANSYVG